MKLIKLCFKMAAVIICAGILCAAYAFLIEPKLLTTKEYTMEAPESTGKSTLKVVQISDIHYGKFFDADMFQKLVDKVNAQQPDILLFTGDLYDVYASSPDTGTVIEKLSQMEATVGKYSIWGNRDYGGGASRIYAEVMEASGFTLLTNQAVKLNLPSGNTLSLGGMDDSLLGSGSFDQTISQMSQSDYWILMTHEPDVVQGETAKGIDLIVSGHSHGGQVRIPFIDPIYTKLAQTYTRGFYDLPSMGSTKLYVNTGIGTTKIPARFLVPPTITTFTIKF